MLCAAQDFSRAVKHVQYAHSCLRYQNGGCCVGAAILPSILSNALCWGLAQRWKHMDILQVQLDERCVSPHTYWWLDTLLHCFHGCGTDMCGQSSEDARLAPLRRHCSAAVHRFMSIYNTIGCKLIRTFFTLCISSISCNMLTTLHQ